MIQLQGAIFERIRNKYPKYPNTGSSNYFIHHYRRRVIYNDVTRDYVTCYLALQHVAENSCVKCPVHFCPLEYVYSLRYEQKALEMQLLLSTS